MSYAEAKKTHINSESVWRSFRLKNSKWDLNHIKFKLSCIKKCLTLEATQNLENTIKKGQESL